eukprot:9659808-Alexandrium_andersonii.AAC.1
MPADRLTISKPTNARQHELRHAGACSRCMLGRFAFPGGGRASDRHVPKTRSSDRKGPIGWSSKLQINE